MNKEDYVSLEVAKLLKEKGFNYEVLSYYDLISEEYMFDLYPKEYNFTYRDKTKISRSTLYEAQKWLREVHNIHVMIGVDDLDWRYQLYDCSEDGRMEETNHFSGSVACQKSYEESLNNGIFDALQLI